MTQPIIDISKNKVKFKRENSKQGMKKKKSLK